MQGMRCAILTVSQLPLGQAHVSSDGGGVRCRGALLPDQAALEGWTTSSPLLVMGSHTWNTPNEKGQLFCGGERQEQVFASAAR